MATKLIPSRATVEPPSGTPTVLLLAAKVKNGSVPVAIGMVNAHLALVVSNPLPLMVPVPVMFRKLGVWLTIVELRRWNVNPPTDQSVGVSVEGLNVHGLMVAVVPSGTKLEKLPVVVTIVDLSF